MSFSLIAIYIVWSYGFKSFIKFILFVQWIFLQLNITVWKDCFLSEKKTCKENVDGKADMVNFHAVIGIQYYPLLFTIFLCSIKLWFNFLCMSGIANLLYLSVNDLFTTYTGCRREHGYLFIANLNIQEMNSPS